MTKLVCGLLVGLAFLVGGGVAEGGTTAKLEIAGVTVTPHVLAEGMRYSRVPDPSLGARVQLFLRNAGPGPLPLDEGVRTLFRGKTPEELLNNKEWSWHDTPMAWPGETLTLAEGALTVWQFNGSRADWGVGTKFGLEVVDSAGAAWHKSEVSLASPRAWISAATFLGAGDAVAPDRLAIHVRNETGQPLGLASCRLWLPAENASFRSLLPGESVTPTASFPAGGVIPAGDKGGAIFSFPTLPLTYTAIELRCREEDGREVSLWARLRIKRERFDISGGWVASHEGGRQTLAFEPYLKTLRRMHINTGHIADTPGYTDQTGPDGLYTRYPLKYFNRLTPFEAYDTDAMLPRIHAVEFLGEPQYGGGRPVPPMEVWKSLAPYQRTRLATTLTHSEERVWRQYAGLSDFPHYDAYRVSAPSPDAWWKYDRWEGRKILWGAPLETIGEMCRSLRELNRPSPTAYWSQGPHDWDMYGGRKRTSPTPDELRLQAYHALSSRITSLYWFNLSLKSLVKFPDLIDAITRVGREIRMLEEFYLEGDAYEYRRVSADGKPDWDLASIASPRGAILYALDLAYTPDGKERVFQFGPPRQTTLRFRLPGHLRQPAAVLQVDADGVQSREFRLEGDHVSIAGEFSKMAMFVVTNEEPLAKELSARRERLVQEEDSVRFDPGRSAEDLDVLRSFRKKPD